MESAQPIASPAEGRGREPAWLEFFWILVRRDLKVRYAGATLGALWNLIQPIVMMIIYIVIFSAIIPRGSEAGGTARDYVYHLCSGMLVWLVFAEALSRGVTSLVDNRNLLQKVSFPPLTLHASVLFNVLVIYGAGFFALCLILLASGGTLRPSALGVLPILILAGAAGCGLSMALSPLHVFFRDTGQLVQIALQIGFWLNPIVYTRQLLEHSPLGRWPVLLRLNPIENFITTAQHLFGSPWAQPWPLAGVVVIGFPLLCLGAGWAVFRRLLPEVRDGL